ncbi:MAG: TRAP transporter substrate-binding protein DctP, partial [Myxococcota bacterium]|nr:TRAP transporter substrate-binding protein DctP [Myxococcota bacterium]
DNTPLFSIAAGWVFAISHFTMSEHIYQPAAVVYAQSFIDSLPADLKRIVLKKPRKEAAYARKKVRAMNELLVATMRKQYGVKVVHLSNAQKKLFRKAVRKQTHAAFLSQNRAEMSLYAEIKRKLKVLRKK